MNPGWQKLQARKRISEKRKKIPPPRAEMSPAGWDDMSEAERDVWRKEAQAVEDAAIDGPNVLISG